MASMNMTVDRPPSHTNPSSQESSMPVTTTTTTTIASVVSDDGGLLTPLSASSSNVNLSTAIEQDILVGTNQRQTTEALGLLVTAKANALAESLSSAAHGTQTPPTEPQEHEQPSPYYATSALTEAMGPTAALPHPAEYTSETPASMGSSYYLSYSGQLEGGEEDHVGSDEQYQDDLLQDASGFGLPTRVQTISTTHPDPSNPNGPPVTTISYLCPWEGCAKSFSRYFNLRSHYRIHSGEKPYVCPDCNLAFARNHDLKRHARIHSGQKPYLCPHCRKTFSRNDAMSRHVRLASCLARGPPASRDGTSIANLDDLRLGPDSHHNHGHGHGHHHGPLHGYSTSGMLMEDNGRRRSGLRYNEKDDLNYFRGHPSEREEISDATGEPHAVGMRSPHTPFPPPYNSTLARLASPVPPSSHSHSHSHSPYNSGSAMPGLYSAPLPYYGESSPVASAPHVTATSSSMPAASMSPHDHQQHPSAHYAGNGPHGMRFTHAPPMASLPYYAHGYAHGHGHAHSHGYQQQHPYYSATRFSTGGYGGSPMPSMNVMMHPMPNPAYPQYRPSSFPAFPYGSNSSGGNNNSNSNSNSNGSSNSHGGMVSASPSPSPLKPMPPRYNEEFHTSTPGPHSMP